MPQKDLRYLKGQNTKLKEEIKRAKKEMKRAEVEVEEALDNRYKLKTYRKSEDVLLRYELLVKYSESRDASLTRTIGKLLQEMADAHLAYSMSIRDNKGISEQQDTPVKMKNGYYLWERL
jgi:hypothetical protein